MAPSAAEQGERRMLRGTGYPHWLLGAAKPPFDLAITLRAQDQGDGAAQGVMVRLVLSALLGHELWSPSCVQGGDVKKRGSSPIDES